MNKKNTDEVISRTWNWNHHMKGCICRSSLHFELLLPPSPCSVLHPELSADTSVLWKVSLRGVWGHGLIACDMLTWLLWLTWPPNIQPPLARSMLDALCALSQRPSLPEETPQMFPPPLQSVCRLMGVWCTMAAWCVLFIWSCTHICIMKVQ